jgi:hypothetical protein
MPSAASDLSRALSRNVEAVCRHYLPDGRREGNYWMAGDVGGSSGRSLYIRLKGSDRGKGAAGKWTDAATGEHGDLLDLIALNQGHDRLADTIAEARRFLSLPVPALAAHRRELPAPRGSRKAAERLFTASRSIAATTAETYLRGRAITGVRTERWLRFHPNCWYRPDQDDAPDTPQAFPALIAAVTDNQGNITGVHRTWLDPLTHGKAAVATPRRAMGILLGHGVRFGNAGHVMAAGEGLETVLSLRMPMGTMPMIACLSSAHLSAIVWPEPLRRLYVVRDRDPAGDAAWAALADRGARDGIDILPLQTPSGNDFNDAFLSMGVSALAAALAAQLMPDDAARFLMA